MKDEDWRLAHLLAVSLVSVGEPQPNTAALLASFLLSSKVMDLVTGCNPRPLDLICCYQSLNYQKLLILLPKNHTPNAWIDSGL